jgi:hypothetical protein
MQSNHWKSRFNSAVDILQKEFKKTTEIGKKMIDATQSNSELHERYEELGLLALSALKSGELKWENERVHDILMEIEELEKALESIEKDVQNIKSKE